MSHGGGRLCVRDLVNVVIYLASNTEILRSTFDIVDTLIIKTKIVRDIESMFPPRISYIHKEINFPPITCCQLKI